MAPCYNRNMRLYLSSYRLGNHPEKLLTLLRGRTKVALIANAVDFRTPQEILERNQKDVEELHNIGLEVTEVDLKDYFGKKEALEHELKKYDLIWVRGGNAFVLRRAFKYSGADEIVKDLLAEDEIVYGGYSAGVCILASSLQGIDIVDDPNVTPNNYQSTIIWEGLDILPYAVAPHYQSAHPESIEIDKTVAYFKENLIPFKTLRDGEVIVRNGDKDIVLR